MSVAIKPSGPAPDVSSFRLLGTMASTGAVAGLLIVVAYTSTHPIILANRASAIERAIHEVLPGIDRYQPLYDHDGGLTTDAPRATTSHEPEHIYVGFKGQEVVGFAIPAKEPGFQDPIELLFGFDPKSNTTLGVTIISSRETPGLGDKIQDDTWRAQFKGVSAPVNATKRGAIPPGDVLMITGATISSRAVVTAINSNLERWRPLIGSYSQGVQP